MRSRREEEKTEEDGREVQKGEGMVAERKVLRCVYTTVI